MAGKKRPGIEDSQRIDKLTDKILEKAVFTGEELSKARLDPNLEAPLLEPGTRFGRFEIVRVVGHGGTGEVYLAHDADLDRNVALKVLTRISSEDTERFKREAQLAARITHPGIVQIHEIGRADGRMYLSMQYVEGNVIDAVSLNSKEVLRALRDIAEAVHVAHSQGIVHRDIKPGNILVDRLGNVFLTDFGVAKQTLPVSSGSGLNTTGAIMGTPCFMSPEQARGETHLIDARTDVYALGATLYKLLTRAEPFIGNSHFEILQKVVSLDPVRPSRLNRSLTRDFDTVIEKAMAKERDRRYATAHDFAEELQRLLDGEPIRAVPASMTYRAGKFVRKHRTASLLSSLLIGMTAAASILIYSSRSESEIARAQRRAAGHLVQGREYMNHVIDLSGRESPETVSGWARRAVAEFDQAALEDPTDPSAHLLKAATLYWAGHYDEAETELAGVPAGADYRAPLLQGRIRLVRFTRTTEMPVYLMTAVGPRFLYTQPGDRSERGGVVELFREALRQMEGLPQDEQVLVDRQFAIGAIAYLEGRPGQAADNFDRAIRSGMRARDVEVLACLAHYRQGAFETAVERFQTLLNLRYDTGRVRVLYALSLLGYGVSRTVVDPAGDTYLNDARKEMNTVLREGAKTAALLTLRGLVHFALGKYWEGQGDDPTREEYSRATADLMSALAEDPSFPPTYRALGLVRLAVARIKARHGRDPAKEIGDAIDYLNQAMELDPLDVDTLTLRGEAALAHAGDLMRRGKDPRDALAEARSSADDAISIERDHLGARDLRVRCYREFAMLSDVAPADAAEGVNNALMECRLALLRVDSNAWLLLRQAQLEWDRIELHEMRHEPTGDQVIWALQAVQKALDANPYLGSARALKGRLLIVLGYQEEAAGRDPEAYWELAKTAIEKTFETNARLFEAHIARALLHIAWGEHARRAGQDGAVHFDAAEVELQAAADVAPGEPELFYSHAWLDLKRGRFRSAVAWLEQCMESSHVWRERARRLKVAAERFMDGY